MRRTVIDIREMSDSKEVYGQRPNPFLPALIYCLTGLLLAALVYSFFGKIEIVASASGVVRPNDDVSTVSCLLSGRVTEVCYTDGQLVAEGDTLLVVDTSEAQIALSSLLNTQEEYQTRADLLEKFIGGVEAGENPFSPDPDGGEYPYYVQYRDYELSLRDTQDAFAYDQDRNAADIVSATEQVARLQTRLAGLRSYKNSVEQGRDLAAAYPEYEELYELYAAGMAAIDAEYQAQRDTLELDSSGQSTQYYLDYYETQIVDYRLLLQSIRDGESAFPAGSESACALLYGDYLAGLASYERSRESAAQTYDYYKNGGGTSASAAELLAYDRTMLEGYTYYRQSVEDGEDRFSDGSESVYYRSLYTRYRTEYDPLAEAADRAAAAYETLLSDPEADPEELGRALTEKTRAETARDDFRTAALSSIDVTLLQIGASIAEKELSLGTGAMDYNTENARIQLENAQAALDSYKNSMLSQYGQALSELESKRREYQLAGGSARDKQTLLDELDASWKNARDTRYYETLSGIDTSIRSAETELSGAQSSLRLYRIAESLYKNGVDENGEPVSLALATVEELSSLLSSQEAVSDRLDELDTQIRQTREQIDQGTIRAGRSGVLNAVATVVTGDRLAAGTVLATIIPPSQSEYKVQLYVSNSDIAGIEPGDPIRYNLAALPSSQYGTLSGAVTAISSDALIRDGQYSGYFLVEGSIANTELTDRDGNVGAVGVGMQVQARIVTQDKSIFRYLLEKIDLTF